MAINEELAKLIKEYGLFNLVSEPSDIDDVDDYIAAVLTIDLAAAGYFKPYIGLQDTISSLFPGYRAVDDILHPDDNGLLTVILEDIEKGEQYKAYQEKREQKLHAHIKKTAKLHFYGDTNVPDYKKEVVCKAVFNVYDYFPSPPYHDHGKFDAWFWSVTANCFSEYEWVHINGGYTFGNYVHVVLVSKALLRNHLERIAANINKEDSES
ncbi:hypothetical protein KL86DPRO_11699 [uncultured delta proteobacterium]|uniref:Uncharacterized protein n=1 Tax=uncultured delta proteobacterium TaxID=34034 RepID=A0A212JKL3_9DELT|nr:hypothetical protein KL86DPRO_11699 [uncultured delta proteobacterium]